jgi:hypothetical protein
MRRHLSELRRSALIHYVQSLPHQVGVLAAHDRKEVSPITYTQRGALRVSVVLLIVAGALLATAWHSGAGLAPTVRTASANPGALTFYGADTTMTINAIKYIWPQAGPYCGIETAEAALNYDDEVHGLGMRFRSTADHKTVAKNNQTSGAS